MSGNIPLNNYKGDKVQQLAKKDFAIALLKEKKPVKFIQDQMKETFGTGMSNRDLAALRTDVRKNMILRTFDNYKQATVDLYEATLGLQKILKILTKNEFPPEVQEWYNDICPIIQKYRNFYHETRKELIVKDLPPNLRNPKIIQSIMESLDEIKNGDFVSL